MNKTCTFIFFRNTPFNDFQNTIHFKNNVERDKFFLEDGHYTTLDYGSTQFNYIRDKSSITIKYPYESFDGINYCSFKEEYTGKRFYAFVESYEYVREGLTLVNMIIDTVMTYTQGDVLMNLNNIIVDRQHLSMMDYRNSIDELRTNDDILKTSTKKYIFQKIHRMTEFYIMFTCACDLTGSFGTQDSPTFSASKGCVFDNISSPVNLYIVPQNKFNELCELLAPFPWISQNIKKVLQIPTEIIDNGQLIKQKTLEIEFDELYSFPATGGRTTYKGEPVEDLTISKIDLYKMHALDMEQDIHLLRNEYTTIELLSWNGQQIYVDPAYINEDLKICRTSVCGYHNQISFYIKDYMTTGTELDIKNKVGESISVAKGQFLNNSLIFNNFDEVPVQIDNYSLALANSANRRELTEQKLISNRLQSIVNPNDNLQDRFYNAVSVLSNAHPMNILGKFTDEYEYYRMQKAEFADMALTPNSITNQTTGNSFQIATDCYGVTIKISSINTSEWRKVKKYYKFFGYELKEYGTHLSNINSMSLCNYVKFSGNWHLNSVDVQLQEQLKILFENGIRLWHNNNTPNPFSQNIMENIIVK